MTRQIETYNHSHVFVDIDELIFIHSGDAFYQTNSDCMHYQYSIVDKWFYISTLSVAQLIFVYQKRKTNEAICTLARELQHRISIIKFTLKDNDVALTQTSTNLENNVQFVLTRRQKYQVIITNDYKGYRLLLDAQIVKPSKVRTLAC